MGIKKDAEEILVYIYKNKVDGKEYPQDLELIKSTKWEHFRVMNAIEYLINKKIIEGNVFTGQGTNKIMRAGIKRITPEGIDILEDNIKFKTTFGHEINLGFYKFSWGVEER